MNRTSEICLPGRHGSNVLPANLSPVTLLAATEAGWLVWARSEQGPLFKAGGSVPRGHHSGREIWITLMRVGLDYRLALTTGARPYGEPVHDSDSLFCRCTLGKLWAAVEQSLA